MTYKAVAKNEAGEAESSAELTVTPSTLIEEPEKKPLFLHPLKDVSADEGQSLVIEAPFEGNPIPNVQWFKDGEPLIPTDRIWIACDGKKVLFIFYKLKYYNRESTYSQTGQVAHRQCKTIGRWCI